MTGLKTKISTPRVEESVEFYSRWFGMDVLESWDEPEDRGVILGFSTPEAEAFLEIYHCERLGSYDAISLQFRVDSAEAFIRSIRGQVEFRGPTPRPWGSLYVYLTDPSGIQIVVYEGGL
ncbi:MAG: VOC family protein [Thermoanaerobaculia bacterium]|nr:VOC family protein [Thermoanaerobaculia bacterium]